jgi:hypothetical protein
VADGLPLSVLDEHIEGLGEEGQRARDDCVEVRIAIGRTNALEHRKPAQTAWRLVHDLSIADAALVDRDREQITRARPEPRNSP